MLIQLRIQLDAVPKDHRETALHVDRLFGYSWPCSPYSIGHLLLHIHFTMILSGWCGGMPFAVQAELGEGLIRKSHGIQKINNAQGTMAIISIRL